MLKIGSRITLKCLGHVDGPRFLDGRTADGTVGLAPEANQDVSGAFWEVRGEPNAVLLRCAGHIPGPRFLDGRTADGTVGLIPAVKQDGLFDEPDPALTGARWSVLDVAPNEVIFTCLGHVHGPRFLDGRTEDGTVGLAPQTGGPFTGTRWLVEVQPAGPIK